MRIVALAMATLMLSVGVAGAQTFQAALGDRAIGTVTLDRQGATLSLASRFTNTPLGVGNGSFTAKSSDEGGGMRRYASEASRKNRSIEVLLEGGRAMQVGITPPNEATALSDPAAVPADVIDPVQAFARIVDAGDCPAPLRFYDGRRVVEVATAGIGGDTARQICDMRYRVVAGPGHLSPFRFTTLNLQLIYADGALAELTVGAGPFAMRLSR